MGDYSCVEVRLMPRLQMQYPFFFFFGFLCFCFIKRVREKLNLRSLSICWRNMSYRLPLDQMLIGYYSVK